jgi:hypothetical protein
MQWFSRPILGIIRFRAHTFSHHSFLLISEWPVVRVKVPENQIEYAQLINFRPNANLLLRILSRPARENRIANKHFRRWYLCLFGTFYRLNSLLSRCSICGRKLSPFILTYIETCIELFTCIQIYLHSLNMSLKLKAIFSVDGYPPMLQPKYSLANTVSSATTRGQSGLVRVYAY